MTAYKPRPRGTHMPDHRPELEDRIRERAYLLWELEGKQDGGVQKYWERARQLIEAEASSSYPPTQSQGNRR